MLLLVLAVDVLFDVAVWCLVCFWVLGVAEDVVVCLKVGGGAEAAVAAVGCEGYPPLYLLPVVAVAVVFVVVAVVDYGAVVAIDAAVVAVDYCCCYLPGPCCIYDVSPLIVLCRFASACVVSFRFCAVSSLCRFVSTCVVPFRFCVLSFFFRFVFVSFRFDLCRFVSFRFFC